jgi:hypothetical protein
MLLVNRRPLCVLANLTQQSAIPLFRLGSSGVAIRVQVKLSRTSANTIEILIGDLTVHENVELPLTYRGMRVVDRKKRVFKALERRAPGTGRRLTDSAGRRRPQPWHAMAVETPPGGRDATVTVAGAAP